MFTVDSKDCRDGMLNLEKKFGFDLDLEAVMHC
jgi:hypothetical protein